MVDTNYFANRLKQLRAEAGLSQPALAERCDISVSAIRHFEYGLREPSYDSLVKLATGLGVSLSAFDPPAEKPATPKRRPGRPPGGKLQVPPAVQAEIEAEMEAAARKQAKTGAPRGGEVGVPAEPDSGWSGSSETANG